MKDVLNTVHQESGLLCAHLVQPLLLLFAKNSVIPTTLVRLEIKVCFYLALYDRGLNL